MQNISSFLILFTIFSSCEEKIPPTAKTETFKVWGNCSMCEKTIEGSLESDHIYMADWNKETKMMTIIYDTVKYNLVIIQKKIAATGYDTELETGDDNAYDERPECCKYERKSNK